MKVWLEQAGDHSAKLRIVGTFKTEEDAEKAVITINGLITVLQGPQTKDSNGPISKEVLGYLSGNNYPLSREAVDSCQYHDPVDRVDNSIEVKTDEYAIQVFIEAFIQNGGRIQIHSRHDYPD